MHFAHIFYFKSFCISKSLIVCHSPPYHHHSSSFFSGKAKRQGTVIICALGLYLSFSNVKCVRGAFLT